MAIIFTHINLNLQFCTEIDIKKAKLDKINCEGTEFSVSITIYVLFKSDPPPWSSRSLYKEVMYISKAMFLSSTYYGITTKNDRFNIILKIKESLFYGFTERNRDINHI